MENDTMERMTKWLLLTLLSLLALILVGSSRTAPRPETTDAERAALVFSDSFSLSDGTMGKAADGIRSG